MDVNTLRGRHEEVSVDVTPKATNLLLITKSAPSSLASHVPTSPEIMSRWIVL